MITIYDWICTLNHLKICFLKQNYLALMSHPISCTEPKLLPELLVSLNQIYPLSPQTLSANPILLPHL